MNQAEETVKQLSVSALLVTHIDPLDLYDHFWGKGERDELGEYSVEYLHKCISLEIEHWETADPETDEDFFSLVTLDGKLELVSLVLLELPVMLYCRDGEYRHFPSLIMTVRNK